MDNDVKLEEAMDIEQESIYKSFLVKDEPLDIRNSDTQNSLMDSITSKKELQDNASNDIKLEMTNEHQDITQESESVKMLHSSNYSIVVKELPDDLYENHSIKEEMVIGPEVMQPTQDKIDNTQESESDQKLYSFNDSTVVEELPDDLYENHTIKEDIVIGPEVMQPTQDKICYKDNANTENKLIKRKLKQIYECSCGKTFDRKGRFDKHNCNTLKVFECDYCQFNTMHKPQITSHLKICNKIIEQKQLDRCFISGLRLSYKHRCKLCNKRYKLKSSFDKHMNLHTQKPKKL